MMPSTLLKMPVFNICIMTFVFLLLVPCYLDAQKNKNRKSLIIRIDDVKEFKKVLRTKTNLLVICSQSEVKRLLKKLRQPLKPLSLQGDIISFCQCCYEHCQDRFRFVDSIVGMATKMYIYLPHHDIFKSEKATAKVSHIFEEVAEEMKGKATLAYINCGDDKKVCKQLKVTPTTFDLRHYKDGEYNKDYDRKLAVKSMVNFLLDPTGDLPWEEDPTAVDVVHITSEDSFSKLLKKDKNPLLVMFYAPWCGYCKRLKPEFAAAASEVKNDATLVGIDVDKPHMMHLRLQYNITGFPTLYYFENGHLKFKYGGENNKAGIISWLRNPQESKEKETEVEWADENSNVFHLTDLTFNEFIKQNPSVLVMFYAPWCGHCKQMKPGYTEAAQFLKDEEIPGVLAAVDATKEKKIALENNIKGFPTIRYFRNGEFAFEVNERDKDKIIEFMKDPKEPPPPPPQEMKWEEIESDIVHLTDDTFKQFLKKKKHCLVMFYAPWCGHCKKSKPEYMAAATVYKEDPKVAFAAVDCTVHTGTCNSHDVKGYPTFKYFNYGKNAQKYMGGREKNDFITFMKDPQNAAASSSNSLPVETLENQWKFLNGYQSLQFLTSTNFDSVIAENVQTLVMFYAPWCGHCKQMKPDFAEAAEIVKKEGLGTLGVVDATIEKELADKFNIKGFPTLKLFTDGHEIEYSSGRAKEDLVQYMIQSLYGEEAAESLISKKNSSKNEEKHFLPSHYVHKLTTEIYKQFIKEKAAVFVMFYKPDLVLCQTVKPHFLKAAKTPYAHNNYFAAVDCTQEEALCSMENILTYPSFYLYFDGTLHKKFIGAHHYATMVNFINFEQKSTSKGTLENIRKDREDL